MQIFTKITKLPFVLLGVLFLLVSIFFSDVAKSTKAHPSNQRFTQASPSITIFAGDGDEDWDVDNFC